MTYVLASNSLSLRHMRPFITQPEDYPPELETDVSLARTLRELRQEKIDLESQLIEQRQKLADSKLHHSTLTSFAPLASIFPMRRDAFGQTKSATQQLKIYRTEWKATQERFDRANDTNYTYELDRLIEKKRLKVKELEREQVVLKANVQLTERKLVRLKGDEADENSTASMIDMASHLTLLKEQVRTLELAAEQSVQAYQEGEENLKRAQTRYRKMKLVAKEFGISLRSSTVQPTPTDYETLKMRFNRLEKKRFPKEEQRIRDLIEEERRLKILEKQMKMVLVSKETELADMRDQVPSRSAHVSPKLLKQHIPRNASLLLSTRRRY